MVRTRHKVDELPPKAVKKKYSPKIWAVIFFCIVGLVGIAIFVELKVENLYKNNDSTRDFENNFITSCKSQGSSSSDCECMFTALKQNYTFDQIKEFDKNPNSIGTKLVLDKIVGQCKRR